MAYDPEMPIDLSGTPGVTPQEQAFAENLIARTVVELPQWSDPAVAEAAGFHSIGDGATGHEHFIQRDWINDDVVLEPDFPESLVYEPQPDGTCTAPLVRLIEAPMIHVWITPTPCGPFAALDGIGAGQIADGETRLCDHDHGDH